MMLPAVAVSTSLRRRFTALQAPVPEPRIFWAVSHLAAWYWPVVQVVPPQAGRDARIAVVAPGTRPEITST